MVKTLLVIEDSRTMQKVFEFTFKHSDFELQFASNGKDGLKSALAAKPSVIVVDISLPDINGLQLIKQLRENPATKTIPIIALSGNAGETNQTEAEAHGAWGFIRKPFDSQTMQDLAVSASRSKVTENKDALELDDMGIDLTQDKVEPQKPAAVSTQKFPAAPAAAPASFQAAKPADKKAEALIEDVDKAFKLDMPSPFKAAERKPAADPFAIPEPKPKPAEEEPVAEIALEEIEEDVPEITPEPVEDSVSMSEADAGDEIVLQSEEMESFEDAAKKKTEAALESDLLTFDEDDKTVVQPLPVDEAAKRKTIDDFMDAFIDTAPPAEDEAVPSLSAVEKEVSFGFEDMPSEGDMSLPAEEPSSTRKSDQIESLLVLADDDQPLEEQLNEELPAEESAPILREDKPEYQTQIDIDFDAISENEKPIKEAVEVERYEEAESVHLDEFEVKEEREAVNVNESVLEMSDIEASAGPLEVEEVRTVKEITDEPPIEILGEAIDFDQKEMAAVDIDSAPIEEFVEAEAAAETVPEAEAELLETEEEAETKPEADFGDDVFKSEDSQTVQSEPAFLKEAEILDEQEETPGAYVTDFSDDAIIAAPVKEAHLIAEAKKSPALAKKAAAAPAPQINEEKVNEMVLAALKKMTQAQIEAIVWEVVPHLAEIMIKKELKNIAAERNL